jgi:hypothetical protein
MIILGDDKKEKAKRDRKTASTYPKGMKSRVIDV